MCKFKLAVSSTFAGHSKVDTKRMPRCDRAGIGYLELHCKLHNTNIYIIKVLRASSRYFADLVHRNSSISRLRAVWSFRPYWSVSVRRCVDPVWTATIDPRARAWGRNLTRPTASDTGRILWPYTCSLHLSHVYTTSVDQCCPDQRLLPRKTTKAAAVAAAAAASTAHHYARESERLTYVAHTSAALMRQLESMHQIMSSSQPASAMGYRML